MSLIYKHHDAHSACMVITDYIQHVHITTAKNDNATDNLMGCTLSSSDLSCNLVTTTVFSDDVEITITHTTTVMKSSIENVNAPFPNISIAIRPSSRPHSSMEPLTDVFIGASDDDDNDHITTYAQYYVDLWSFRTRLEMQTTRIHDQ